MCQIYENIRTQYMALRSILIDEEHVLTDDVHRFDRTKRGIGSALKRLLGLADRRRQQRLAQMIGHMEADLFSQKGHIVNLNYIVAMQNKKLTQLANITMNYLDNMHNLSITFNKLQTEVEDHMILNKHAIGWIADALIAGSLYNQILTVHNNLLNKRIKVIGDIAQGVLTPDVIGPKQLEELLSDLQQELSANHDTMRLTSIDIWDHYHINNLVHVIRNGSIYINLPVTLQMQDQVFTLYTINTFMVPVVNEPTKATLIVDYVDLIAVNYEQNSYFTMSRQFYMDHCVGRTIIKCDRLLQSYDFELAPTCASVVFRNQLEVVQKYCKIGFVNIESSYPLRLIDYGNSSLLLVNPNGQPIYARCEHYGRRKEITRERLVTIHMQCYCNYFNDVIKTPIYVHANCTKNRTLTTITHVHHNMLYLVMVMNKTADQIYKELNSTTLQSIPRINMPTYNSDSTLLREGIHEMQDFQKILDNQRTIFANSIPGRIQQNSENIKEFNVYKYVGLGISVIVSILVIFVILLTCKTKNLSQLLAIGKLLPSVKASPLHSEHTGLDLCKYTSPLLLLFLTLSIAYFIYRYIATIKRIVKLCAFPFKEFDITDKPSPLNVLFYFHNLHNFCYIHVDQLFASPHEVELIQSSTDVDITLHDRLFCSSYITITHTNLGLNVKGKNTMFTFNKTLSIPIYNKFTMRKIIDTPHELEVLVGENRIYRTYKVILRRQV